MQYADTAKQAQGQAVIDLIGASGKLEIGDDGFANILAVVALANPAGSVDSVGTITFDLPSGNTIAISGDAFEARIRDGSDADVITALEVGTSGQEIEVNDTAFVMGQTFTLTVASITKG